MLPGMTVPGTTEGPGDARTLVLMRHAKAEHTEGKRDSERELTPKGRADAVVAGQWLAEHEVVPDVVLCSTSVRTRQTWDAVLDGGAECDDVRYESGIYDGGAGAILSLVTEADPDARTILVIGHAPSIPWLAATLSADTGDDDEDGFPTCAFAVLSVGTAWPDLSAGAAELTETVVPRA